MFDMIAHLTRQAAFSRATFGPGPRTKGVCEHIRSELKEIEAEYADTGNAEARHEAAAKEWTDVAILGLDGLLRALWSAYPGFTAAQIASLAVDNVHDKQGKNELRNWPNWRTVSQDEAIEHDRSGELPRVECKTSGPAVTQEVQSLFGQFGHVEGVTVNSYDGAVTVLYRGERIVRFAPA